jgi:hypothetical protein
LERVLEAFPRAGAFQGIVNASHGDELVFRGGRLNGDGVDLAVNIVAPSRELLIEREVIALKNVERAREKEREAERERLKEWGEWEEDKKECAKQLKEGRS